MLFLFFWFQRVSAGPQKPQTLMASKTKYVFKFWDKNLDSLLKNKYFAALMFQEREFVDQ